MTGSRAESRDSARTRAWWVPTGADFFFALIIYWCFVASPAGWTRLLGDADTGFHVRVGDAILTSGAIPHQHLFSFAAPGAEWIDFEWLSQVWFAVLEGRWGLNGVVFFCGLALSLAILLTVVNAVRGGAGGLAAILAGLVSASAMSLHFLARPHVFTLLLLAVSALVVEADRRRRTGALWLLVPLAALWANLHAGFMILFAWLGVVAATTLAEGWLWREVWVARRRAALRYAMLGAACAVASLVNPYGYRLHGHLIQTLRTSWYFELVDEFRAPDFRNEAHLSFLLLLAAGTLLVPGMLRRRKLVEPAIVLGFGYLGLMAVRNIPVFAVLAAPAIAVEASRLWSGWAGGQSRTSAAGVLEEFNGKLAPGLRVPSVWTAVVAASVVVWAGGEARGFPSDRFPARILEHHREQIAQSRLLTTDQWANFALFQNYPRQRVFIDSQHHAYPAAVLRETLETMSGGKAWKRLLDDHTIEAVLCPSGAALATLLRGGGDGWKVVEEDSLALYAVRAASSGPSPPSSTYNALK
jgi:hypothetical protein